MVRCRTVFGMLFKPGASIPSETMMHFPPVSDFPPVFEKFSDSEENFTNLTFSCKISSFSSAEISDDLFLSHRPQILNFPLFSLFQYISPCFAKIIIPPSLQNFPPLLDKFTSFLLYFLCISFLPYFDHDVFMHHPMHVLDAPESPKSPKTSQRPQKQRQGDQLIRRRLSQSSTRHRCMLASDEIRLSMVQYPLTGVRPNA